MNARRQLEILQDVYDEEHLGQIVGKLLDETLNRYQLRLERYEQDLGSFEEQYGMASPVFYERFEQGVLGDAMDYFEWSGLYELYLDLQKKTRQLEQAR